MLRPTRQVWRDDASPDWFVDYDDGIHVQPDERRPFVLHRLRGEDVIAFHLDANVVREGGSLRIDLRNDSGRRIRDLRLLYASRVYELGSLEEDGQLVRTLRASDGDDIDAQAWWRVLDDSLAASDGGTDAAQMLLARRHRERSRVYDDAYAQAVLFGFTDSPVLLAGDDARWRVSGVNVVLAKLPVAQRGGVEAVR